MIFLPQLPLPLPLLHPPQIPLQALQPPLRLDPQAGLKPLTGEESGGLTDEGFELGGAEGGGVVGGGGGFGFVGGVGGVGGFGLFGVRLIRAFGGGGDGVFGHVEG